MNRSGSALHGLRHMAFMGNLLGEAKGKSPL
jgi:hypothetical protein